MTLIHAVAVSVPIFISGIFTTTYHLTATMEGAEKPFAGVIHVGFFGNGEIKIFNHDGGDYCSGKTWATLRKRERVGSKGEAKLSCVDGREINATWKQTSYKGGSGVGEDQKKLKIRFMFFIKRPAKKASESSEPTVIIADPGAKDLKLKSSE